MYLLYFSHLKWISVWENPNYLWRNLIYNISGKLCLNISMNGFMVSEAILRGVGAPIDLKYFLLLRKDQNPHFSHLLVSDI